MPSDTMLCEPETPPPAWEDMFAGAAAGGVRALLEVIPLDIRRVLCGAPQAAILHDVRGRTLQLVADMPPGAKFLQLRTRGAAAAGGDVVLSVLGAEPHGLFLWRITAGPVAGCKCRETPVRGLRVDSVMVEFEDLETIAGFAPLSAPAESGGGRRSERRQLLTVAAEVTPFDANLRPLGEPRECVTLDVSWRGMGVAADVPEGTAYFLVRFRTARGRTVEKLYEVRTSEPFGLVRKLGGTLVTD